MESLTEAAACIVAAENGRSSVIGANGFRTVHSGVMRRFVPLRSRLLLLALPLLSLTAAPASAASNDADAAAAAAVAARPVTDEEVTQRDVARSYVQFEQAMREHAPAGARRIQVTRRFDWVTRLVFRGQYAHGLRELDALAEALLPTELNTPADRAARALRVDVDPAVLVLQSDDADEAPGAIRAPIRIAVRPFYAVEGAPAALTLRLRACGEATELARFPINADGAVLRWPADVERPRAGRYIWEIVTPAGRAWPRGEWDVVESTPSVLRDELLARLAAMRTDDPSLRRSLHAARSRARLLADEPDADNPASFLAELPRFMDDLSAEVATLEAGRNPYAGRAGDYWRTIDAVHGPPLSLPARLYAPDSALAKAARGETIPLVVALHGAGGNEHLFMDGYGAGELKRLADHYGFVVVSPLTYTAMADLRALGTIIEAAGELYPIDSSRVFVIGHSLGAMAAGLWAGQQPHLSAGVALIAGGRPDVQLFPRGSGQPAVTVPTFVAAAVYDGIFPADSQERSVRRAVDGGADVAFQRYDADAHVSIVETALPDVIAWLMADKTRSGR